MSKQSPFSFLKGNDGQFDSAMNSIGNMYDNLFNGDQLDKIFENLKCQASIEPIDEMSREIFQSEPNPHEPAYVKVEEATRHDDTDFVVGVPVYETPYVAPKKQNNYVNPYYQTEEGPKYFQGPPRGYY